MTKTSKSTLFLEIENTIKTIHLESISANRRLVLKSLTQYIQNQVDLKSDIRLNFICTHNSRRSHLAQIWMQTAAAYFDIKNIFCYSGGTEATALFPEIITTMQKQGFQISKLSEASNPIYALKFGADTPAVVLFSKKYNSLFNPANNFAALLTCAEADLGCPFIAGANARIALPYDDPKQYDNTPDQALKYEERSRQIATEMFYVLSQIKH